MYDRKLSAGMNLLPAPGPAQARIVVPALSVRTAITYIFQVKFDNTYLAHPIADQWATVGLPFNFSVPADAFADTDFDMLSFSLSASPVAPGWVTFDTNTATFGGTAARAE